MHLIVYDDTFFYHQILSHASGDSDLNTLKFIDVKSCTITSFNSFNSRRICKSKLRLINHLCCQNAEDGNNVICLQSYVSITNSHHIDPKLIIFNR
jgi:hypothetical protein